MAYAEVAALGATLGDAIGVFSSMFFALIIVFKPRSDVKSFHFLSLEYIP